MRRRAASAHRLRAVVEVVPVLAGVHPVVVGGCIVGLVVGVAENWWALAFWPADLVPCLLKLECMTSDGLCRSSTSWRTGRRQSDRTL